MPIDEEIAQHYPDHWDRLSEKIRSDSPPIETVDGVVSSCEWCRRPVARRVWSQGRSYYRVAENGGRIAAYNRKGERVRTLSDFEWKTAPDGILESPHGLEGRSTEVVLTVAHLCHWPPCDDERHLVALCQACHLWYDSRPVCRQVRERLYSELCGQLRLTGDSGDPVPQGVEPFGETVPKGSDVRRFWSGGVEEV